MKKAVTQISLLLIILCGSCLWFEAQACLCGARATPYGEFKDARAVFVGKVISSKDISTTQKWGDRTIPDTERVFRLSVIESFKGPKTETLDINVGSINTDCYQGFAIGHTYLVYAFGSSDSKLSAGICSRTNTLLYALGDLHYIHNLLKGVPEPRVYGSVVRVDSDLSGSKSGQRVTPLSGIKIIIEGEGGKFEVFTDAQGLYNLARIPDGEYKARLSLPKEYKAYFPIEQGFILGLQGQRNYDVAQGSSAYAAFEVGWNNGLNGRVVDSEGNPIVRAKVNVLTAGATPTVVVQRDEFDYHSDGKFRCDGLNPGRYRLSAEIRAPFADKDDVTTFYYPNAPSLSEAQEISIGENETLDEREIRLPPGYVVRQIEGVLVWPNGVPVSGGWVFLAASDKSKVDDRQSYDWGTTDQLGRFSLQAFVGAEYWLHGESRSSGKGEPIKIKVKMINEPVKVVIPVPKEVDP